MSAEQCPKDQLAIIEQTLAEENDYFQAGLTEEQIRCAAAIILNREPVDEEAQARQAQYQRNSKARKEDVA